MAGAALNRHKSNQEVETDPEFVQLVSYCIGPIVCDLAASAENTQCESFFLTKEDDSLSRDWRSFPKASNPGVYWLNPPYSNIAPWARKCAESADAFFDGNKIAFLVPASVGSNWWADYVHMKARVIFLNGRITFVGHEDPYPKDLALIVYGRDEVVGYEIWDWKKNERNR